MKLKVSDIFLPLYSTSIAVHCDISIRKYLCRYASGKGKGEEKTDFIQNSGAAANETGGRYLVTLDLTGTVFKGSSPSRLPSLGRNSQKQPQLNRSKTLERWTKEWVVLQLPNPEVEPVRFSAAADHNISIHSLHTQCTQLPVPCARSGLDSRPANFQPGLRSKTTTRQNNYTPACSRFRRASTTNDGENQKYYPGMR